MKSTCLFAVSVAAILAGVPAMAQNVAEDAASPAAAPAAESQPSPSGGAEDSDSALATIRAASQAFADAFNKHDAEAVAAHWTKEGDYVDESGRRFAGRDAIQQAYAAFFAEEPQARMRVEIDSLRRLSDTAAIEDGRVIVEPPAAGGPAIGKYTAVHVKTDGKWLMSTVRDSRVELPSNNRYVADLEWLIGKWTAEEHGTKTESTCSWIANKSFVERKYTVTHFDGTTASGVQIIGWNPEGGHVQSWNFSSDGGHAVGVWSLKADGWIAEMRGVSGDGTPTVALNVLTRLDDNAYAWQSFNRSAGGQALPDTDEVVIKRQTDRR